MKNQARSGEVAESKNRQRVFSSGRVLMFIVLAGFLVRGVALWETRKLAPILDERLYLQRAHGLLDGKGYLGSYQSWVRHPHEVWVWIAELPQYKGAYQPPFYPVFIAAIMYLTGRSIFVVKFVQVVLSTLSILLVYKIGRSWFDHRRGLIAAGICAFYPNLISFSHLIWSETLFIFMLLLVVWLLTVPMEPPTLKKSVLAGILLGMLALTRSTIVYFLPLLFAWLVFMHRHKWVQTIRSVGVMFLAITVMIVPWTIRNYYVHGGFVLIDSSGPFNLWRGNAPMSFRVRPKPPGLSYKPPFQAIPLYPVGQQIGMRLTEKVKEMLGVPYPTDLQVMTCAKKLAWDYIRSDPVGFIKRARHKVVDMWNPTSFMIRHFQRGWYGEVDPQVEFMLTWAAVLSYVVVMCLGALGLGLYWRDGRAWLVVLMILFYTAIAVVAFGLTRFRMPLMPFIMLLAAHGLMGPIRAKEDSSESEQATMAEEL